MDELNTLARDAILLGVTGSVRTSNSARKRTGLQKQYFREETLAFTEDIGYLASNVYETAAQGINFDDWYSYVPIKIRVDNAVQVSSGELMTDDWMRIYIIQPTGIDTIGQGAYMFFDNNWWMVYKPKGVTTVRGQALVRRCNTVINKLDYYGNIVSIPMAFTKLGTLGNAPNVTENMILSKNYMNCYCQLNSMTREFTENTRMIQGKAAYAIRGINDFTREYTEEPDSVHIMAFTIQREEPLEQDNLDLQVADYYSFSWVISLNANDHMAMGSTQTIIPTSYRNECLVAGTDEHPISYKFESSDETVLTVSESGEVTTVGEGEATVRVTLNQNHEIRQSVNISVTATGESKVIFTSTPVTVLDEYDLCLISASYLNEGIETEDEVTFTFSGAPTRCYGVSAVGLNKYEVRCFNASRTPLTVTIEAHGSTDSMCIKLYP